MTTTLAGSLEPTTLSDLDYIRYDPDKEAQYLTAIRELISKDLSEPYSIYVYRYFLYQWADLCYMVRFELFFRKKLCVSWYMANFFTPTDSRFIWRIDRCGRVQIGASS